MWPLNIIWKLCILPTKGRLWHSNLAQVTAPSRIEKQQEALGHTCAMGAFRLQSPGVQALIETPLMVLASAKEGGKVWTQLLMGPQMWLVFLPSPNPSAGCLPIPKHLDAAVRLSSSGSAQMGRVDVRWRDLVSLQHQGRWQVPRRPGARGPPRRLAFTPRGHGQSISSLHLLPVPTMDSTGNGAWLYFLAAIFLLLFSFINTCILSDNVILEGEAQEKDGIDPDSLARMTG